MNIWHTTILLLVFLCIYGCDTSPELDRDAAKNLLSANQQYPVEVVKKIKAFEKTQYRNRLTGYAAKVNATDVATASILKKQWYRLEVNPTEAGKVFVRGEEVTEGFNGSHQYLPVAIYSVDFGEITGIAFENAEKTIAVVEFTEIYTPSPFRELYEEGGIPKYSTENRTAIFKLYDDGWRVMENMELKKLERTPPPESFSFEHAMKAIEVKSQNRQERETKGKYHAKFLVETFEKLCSGTGIDAQSALRSLANQYDTATESEDEGEFIVFTAAEVMYDAFVSNESCSISVRHSPDDMHLIIEHQFISDLMEERGFISDGELSEIRMKGESKAFTRQLDYGSETLGQVSEDWPVPSYDPDNVYMMHLGRSF